MSIPTHIGKYVISERAGRGGMGTVYLGHDPDLQRPVAVKVLRDDVPNQELLDRFLREARTAASLDHPNVVTVYEVGLGDDGRPFMAMQYIAGQSLADVIESRQDIPLALKLAYLDQICAGLDAVHRGGIVHRDIKPANLKVDDRGVLRILDFGIARTDGSTMTMDGSSIGTLGYMAPEQLRGEQASERSDIFSLGIVAYELLTGERAFPTVRRAPLRRLGEFLDGLPPGLEAWIIKATADDPSQRFASVGDARAALLAARQELDRDATSLAATAVRPSTAHLTPERLPPERVTPEDLTVDPTLVIAPRDREPSPTPAGRSGTWRWAAAALLVLALTAAATGLTFWPSEPPADTLTSVDRDLVIPRPPAATDPEPTGRPAGGEGRTGAGARPAPPLPAADAGVTPGGGPAATNGRDARDRAIPAADITEAPSDPEPVAPPTIASEAFYRPIHDLRRPASPGGAPTPQAPATASPTGLHYKVLQRRPNGSWTSVDPATTEFRSGDQVRLAFESNVEGYLYVVQQGSSGHWTVLFPSPDLNGGRNQVRAFQEFVFPEPEDPFEFDTTPGRERIFVFLSREPVDAVPGLNRPVTEPVGALVQADVDRFPEIRTRDLIRSSVKQQQTSAKSGVIGPGIFVVNSAAGGAVMDMFELIHK
jgi:eukaryotic-like serine/threonine-protein kinase